MSPIEIRPLEPLVFGDGRPFGDEAGAQVAGGLLMPTPSALAGAVRTTIGRQSPSVDWNELKSVPVHGPVRKAGTVLVPAPSDMAVLQDSTGLTCLVRSRPCRLGDGEGMDLPEGMAPCALPENQLQPTKKDGPQWVSIRQLVAWYGEEDLFGASCSGGSWRLGPEAEGQWTALEIKKDLRAHVGINFETLAHDSGKLFVTMGAAYGQADVLLARVGRDVSRDVLSLGGERRLAASRPGVASDWDCPIRENLASASKVAMVLATPGHFENGWRPARLSETLGVDVKLISALCRRREAVSGWDLLLRRPKPVRWLAPAGSVYFLEVSQGAGTALADNWLAPVSDDAQSRLDGFGLALFFPTDW